MFVNFCAEALLDSTSGNHDLVAVRAPPRTPPHTTAPARFCAVLSRLHAADARNGRRGGTRFRKASQRTGGT